MSPLEEELLIRTPLDEELVRTMVHKDCDVKIGEPKLEVDLIPLDLRDFDAILGMDWLERHHAVVNCFTKVVMFCKPEVPVIVFQGERRVLPTCLISMIDAVRLVRKGCQAYLAHVIDTTKSEARLEDVPVVNEFADVFPDELPGLPPDRELEFAIDLLPGTAPISMPPYRMAPTELAELKTQLQELVDKGFIRPSTSLWGAPVLFVKKKVGTLRLCLDYR